MKDIYLVIYNTEKKIRYVKYFASEFEKDKYKRKVKHIPYLFVVEDSTDIYFTD